MPVLRRQTIHHLRGQLAPQTTKDVGLVLGYPTETARRTLQDLAAHGVATRADGGDGKADLWALTDWAIKELDAFLD